MTDEHEAEREVALTGGVANQGLVVRVGSTVRRPQRPTTETAHAFMAHLRANGVGEVPEPLGLDASGRDMLGWIEGDVSIDHGETDRWIASDDVLVSLAGVHRRMHDAAANFTPPANAVWGTGGRYFPSGVDGPLVCHNDLCVSNVVVANGHQVVGILDFDYLRPVDRRFDIAVACRHWAPLAPPEVRVVALQDVDARARFDTYCDEHKLSASDRTDVLQHAVRFLDQARSNVAELAANGHAGFTAMIDRGYLADNLASTTWIRTALLQ